MKTWILSTLFFGTLLIGATKPADAEAVKIKLKPSISFTQSYHRPRPVVVQRPVVVERHVPVGPAPRVVEYYDPYYPVEYGYYCPAPVCECEEYYYYPHPHHHCRSSRSDFEMRVQVR